MTGKPEKPHQIKGQSERPDSLYMNNWFRLPGVRWERFWLEQALLTVFPPRNYAAYLEIQPGHSVKNKNKVAGRLRIRYFKNLWQVVKAAAGNNENLIFIAQAKGFQISLAF
jgi:hypothetical protein